MEGLRRQHSGKPVMGIRLVLSRKTVLPKRRSEAIQSQIEYITRRMSHRAAALIADNAEEMKAIRRFIRRLYDIRSAIAHGSALGDKNRLWLIKNDRQIEDRVRLALVTAVRNLPPGEDDRRRVLAQLYDPTDEDRAEALLEKSRWRKINSRQPAGAAFGRDSVAFRCGRDHRPADRLLRDRLARRFDGRPGRGCGGRNGIRHLRLSPQRRHAR